MLLLLEFCMFFASHIFLEFEILNFYDFLLLPVLVGLALVILQLLLVVDGRLLFLCECSLLLLGTLYLLVTFITLLGEVILLPIDLHLLVLLTNPLLMLPVLLVLFGLECILFLLQSLLIFEGSIHDGHSLALRHLTLLGWSHYHPNTNITLNNYLILSLVGRLFLVTLLNIGISTWPSQKWFRSPARHNNSRFVSSLCPCEPASSSPTRASTSPPARTACSLPALPSADESRQGNPILWGPPYYSSSVRSYLYPCPSQPPVMSTIHGTFYFTPRPFYFRKSCSSLSSSSLNYANGSTTPSSWDVVGS